MKLLPKALSQPNLGLRSCTTKKPRMNSQKEYNKYLEI